MSEKISLDSSESSYISHSTYTISKPPGIYLPDRYQSEANLCSRSARCREDFLYHKKEVNALLSKEITP